MKGVVNAMYVAVEYVKSAFSDVVVTVAMIIVGQVAWKLSRD